VVGQQISLLAGGNLLAHAQALSSNIPAPIQPLVE